MKKFFLSAIVIALALSFSSCVEDTEESPQPVMDATGLAFAKSMATSMASLARAYTGIVKSMEGDAVLISKSSSCMPLDVTAAGCTIQGTVCSGSSNLTITYDLNQNGFIFKGSATIVGGSTSATITGDFTITYNGTTYDIGYDIVATSTGVTGTCSVNGVTYDIAAM